MATRITSQDIKDGGVETVDLANNAVTAAKFAIVTTKGDLVGFSTLPDRIPVGTNGQVLTADSTVALGVKWAAAGGSGTVTSVGLVLPSEFTVTVSPITTSGDLTAVWANETANLVFAGPATGVPAVPTFRSLVAADIPSLSSIYQPLDADLTAIAALATTGFAARTAADTWALRTITATAPIAIANGDGVAGNPSITHNTTAVTPGSYTNANITVDATGHLTAAANGSSGGGGTVTSVAGGVGLTGTPDPIVGAGTLDLDINSLTSETTFATGDLLAFVDVSVGTTPASQRKVTGGNLAAGINGLLDISLLTGTILDAQLPSLTSSQWAGHVSDETGTGKWVFNDTPTFTTRIVLDNGASLRFVEPGSTNFSAFVAQAQTADITYTLPAADAAGVLTSNGTGGLSWQPAGGTGTVTSVAATAPAAGFTITGSPITTAGTLVFALADDLAALEGLSGTGIAARTAANTWATRTLQAPAAGFTITNPAGVAGDPTFALANDLAALEAMAGTGLVARTAAETYAQRTIGATAPISISNGDGIAGNPAITHDTTAVTPGSYTSANITVNATGHITAAANGTGGGTPSAPDTSVQFNDGGAFGGEAALTYQKTTNTLTITEGALVLDSTLAATPLKFVEPGGANFTSLQAQAMSANLVNALPAANPSPAVSTWLMPMVAHVAAGVATWEWGMASNFTMQLAPNSAGAQDYAITSVRSGGTCPFSLQSAVTDNIGPVAINSHAAQDPSGAPQGSLDARWANITQLHIGRLDGTSIGLGFGETDGYTNVQLAQALYLGDNHGTPHAGSTYVLTDLDGTYRPATGAVARTYTAATDGPVTTCSWAGYVPTTKWDSTNNAITLQTWRALTDESNHMGTAGVTITDRIMVHDAPTIASGSTITTRRGVYLANRASTGTQGTAIGLDMDDQTVGTLGAAVRSAMASGAGKYHLYCSGTAPALFGGQVRFQEPGGVNYAAFVAPALAGDIVWTLPTTDSTGTQALVSNGSGTLSWVTITTDAPVGAQYLTLATDGTLTNERVFTIGNGLDAVDGGAGSTYTVTVDETELTHNSLGGLTTGDPHTQYTLLAGRTGATNDTTLSTDADGTLTGSAGTGKDLILNTQSTGTVRLRANLTSLGANVRSILTCNPTLAFDSILSTIYGYEVGGRHGAQATWTVSTALSSATGGVLFYFNPIVTNTPTTAIANMGGWVGLGFQPTLKADGAACTFPLTVPFMDLTNYVIANAGTSTVTAHRTVSQTTSLTIGSGVTATELTGLYSNPTVTGTATTRRGVWYRDKAGAGTQTNTIAVDVDDQTAGTIACALRSAIAASAGTNYFLRDTGGADSVIKGQVRIGDTTDPTALLDIIGKATWNTSGLLTKYNNVATAGNGQPAIVKVIDLTTQSAAGSGVALWTPSAAGLYRISVALTLTRAGTTSTLGGAGGVKINYTTGDGSVAKNQQVPFWIPGSTTATVINSATNTVGDTLIGAIVVYSSTTAVTYDVGYSSTGGTSMQYALRIRVEAL